jgi:hypothetical protein
VAVRRPESIFVHSLFRAASTYVFNKFRGLGPRFTCYQEPFNEALVALNDPNRHERLLQGPHGSRVLRHPRLDKPYFYEFWARRAELTGLFDASFAYRGYFLHDAQRLPPAQHHWIAALLQHADGIPMLQFCRSSARAAAMRREFGGVHIYLWREPRAQWWSYKVAPYFDEATRHIYVESRDSLPDALRPLSQLVGAGRDRARLSPGDSYLLFYALWLDAWLQLGAYSDLSISIDQIALSGRHNRECSQALSELIAVPIDLSDVRASGMAFTAQEEEFYAEAEHAVEQLFVQSGRASEEVRAAREAACALRAAHLVGEHDAGTERNLRLAALGLMQQLCEPQCGPLDRALGRLHEHLRRYWRALGGRSRAAVQTLPRQRVTVRARSQQERRFPQRYLG